MTKEPTNYEEWMDQNDVLCAETDECVFCLGMKGGVPGNENIIGGHPVCDYCTALFSSITEQRKREQQMFKEIDA